MHPPVARVLRDGIALPTSAGPVTIRHLSMGELPLPTGRLVACDPFVDPSAPPFARHVAPGRYPLSLGIARFARNNDERIAAAWLTLSEAPVVAWEPARLEGVAESAPHDQSWFGVDSGTAGLLSAEAGERALAHEPLADELAAAMARTYQHTRSWALMAIAGARQPELAAFSSGWGDGGYGSWWGLDATGAPAMFLTDLAVLDDDGDELAPSDAVANAPRPWWKFWGA